MATQRAQNQKVIAIFEDWNAASKAKQAIQNAGLAAQKVSIDDHIDPYVQVASMGTTVGRQAGTLLGAFYGGVLGVIFATIESTWVHGQMDVSPFNQLAVVAFTVAGALIGSISGQRFRMAELPARKEVGNPDIPRRFRIVINSGNPDEIAQAQQALGQPTGQGV